MMAEEAEEEEAAAAEAGWSKKNKNPKWQCGEKHVLKKRPVQQSPAAGLFPKAVTAKLGES